MYVRIVNLCYLIACTVYRNLIAEIDSIKSGEAIYNPVLLSELRRALLRIRNKAQNGATLAAENGALADALKDWTPTKEQLISAAGAAPMSSVSPTKSNSNIAEQEDAEMADHAAISSGPPDSPVPAISTVVSPSPTPTPTPSVVVNGEILKPYPSSDVQSTHRTDEVPPLQIQPKRPKDNFTMALGVGFDGLNAERPIEVKQEPTTREPPRQEQQPKALPIQAVRQDLGKKSRTATASPSPPVSEQSVTAHAQRNRHTAEVKSAPISGTHLPTEAAPQSFIPIKREISTTTPRPDRSSTAGVYNHRKIPVKNAASHSVTSGPSLMGEKMGERKPIVVEEPPVAKDRNEPDIVVPDSQEVPDSQDEAGVEETTVKVSYKGPSPSATESSPRKATRAAKKAEVTQMSSILPAQNTDRDQQSDEESNRSELTTPPASPALSAPPSSVERRVKNEEDSADTDMLSPVALSPIASHNLSNIERKATNRGRKRARESEGATPSTPAKRPYQKSGNTQSQDELSPALPTTNSKAGDTDDADREDDGADQPRRGMKRRTSTRGKPSTIEEDSEADDRDSDEGRKSAERTVRKRGHKDSDQASKSS